MSLASSLPLPLFHLGSALLSLSRPCISCKLSVQSDEILMYLVYASQIPQHVEFALSSHFSPFFLPFFTLSTLLLPPFRTRSTNHRIDISASLPLIYLHNPTSYSSLSLSRLPPLSRGRSTPPLRSSKVYESTGSSRLGSAIL